MAQMFDHILDPVKAWPHPNALDFPAQGISALVLYPLRAGQCCSQDSTGKLIPGVATHKMPLFNFQGARSLDVYNAGDDQFQPVSPTGNIMCIPGSAATELRTTEFVPSLTYAREDLLRAPTGNAAANGLDATTGLITTSSSGVLRNDTITLYTTAVVGKVSRGAATNHNNRSMLWFWPAWCPGTA